MKFQHKLSVAVAALLCGLAHLAWGFPTPEELRFVFQRRQTTAAELYNDTESVALWRNSLRPNGTWPDVNYTAGCEARRAEWQALDHFKRIDFMASEFYQNPSDTDLLAKIGVAMDFWFDNDHPHEDCINGGGRPQLNCPCGTPGLWNTNWWYGMIGLPLAIGDACLLLDTHLSSTQRSNCTHQTLRAYDRINGDPNGSLGNHTGANRLDIASSGSTYACMTNDLEILQDAYFQFYDTCQFVRTNLDGVHVDGSFLYHNAQLYTGNYGMHFINQMLRAMMHTIGTSLEPPRSSQDVMLAMLEGSEWMMHFKGDGDTRDPLNLLWQYASSGRMISNKFEDWHGINISIPYIVDGTLDWEDHPRFRAIAERLRNPVPGSANPGPLVGTKYFWIADYLVHRGPRYVVALKMFSPRIVNTECINDQNLLGFHLSDGAIHTHVHGTEYINVCGAWDWWMVPGTTTDWGSTPLVCGESRFHGKEPFVGGVSFGNAGVAVMNYTNPATESLHWAKTYFFFPGAYVVQYVGDFVSTTTAPIITTLDQRQLTGSVYVDGAVVDTGTVRVDGSNVWHDRVGYSFQSPVTLDIDTTLRPANWSAIGISVGLDPERLFSAAVVHRGLAEGETYIAYLDVDQERFNRLVTRTDVEEQTPRIKAMRVVPQVRGATYGSASGSGERIIALAFWDATPEPYSTSLEDITEVSVDIPCVLMLTRKAGGPSIGWTLSVADPTQRASTVQVEVWQGPVRNAFEIGLPTGDFAGSAVTREF